MAHAALTDRQRNELEYYEKYSELAAPPDINFKPILGKEKRPWNSYWYFMEKVQQHFKFEGQRLLDFGCGTGFYSIPFARVGYHVFGFDISRNNIAIANGFAEKYGLQDKCNFVVSVAETLDYPDEHFDVVTGINILHHVDIRNSVGECMRVLKPGGIAMFHEPVRSPLFDAIRESWLGTAIVSKEASFERHITRDERKLSNEDFEILKSFDPACTFERFLLFSRFNRFIGEKLRQFAYLDRLDLTLFRVLPVTRNFAGECIITLRKS